MARPEWAVSSDGRIKGTEAMTRTEWAVNNNGGIRVKYLIDDNEIRVTQGDDWVSVEPADVEGLVQALIEAVEAAGVVMPHLDAQGYTFDATAE